MSQYVVSGDFSSLIHQLRHLNDHLFWKVLFIWFTVCAFHERLSNCMCTSFPFGFQDGMWNFVVLVPDHCPSIFFAGPRSAIGRAPDP